MSMSHTYCMSHVDEYACVTLDEYTHPCVTLNMFETWNTIYCIVYAKNMEYE